VILVTRPGEPGQRLAAQLAAAGRAALWWPAFDLLPPADPQAVQAAVASLAQHDLVVFVSPMAVRAFAAALDGAAWPDGARVAAVGGATLQAARAALRLGAAVRTCGPESTDAAEGGAEALWELLERLSPPPRHVLMVRAQAGRELLAERLRAAGAVVTELEAYRRTAHEPGAGDWAALRAALAAPADASPLVVLFSSTEAVGAVTRRLDEGPGTVRAAGAIALCVHERIAQAARAAGWQDVRRCEPDADSVLTALAARGPATAPALPRGVAG
jgi:uroporphyrinogen III methyltransferase/synthase